MKVIPGGGHSDFEDSKARERCVVRTFMKASVTGLQSMVLVRCDRARSGIQSMAGKSFNLYFKSDKCF